MDAAKKLFRSTAEGQDKTVSNTLAIVPHGSIGLLDHQAQQSANTASDYPCRKDISILTSTTSQASNAYPISETEELSSNSLSDVSQPWLSIFPQNITAPFPMVPLPPPGTLPETTAQLAFCNSLLRIRLSPSLAATASSNTFSDTAQQASVDAILYDSEEQGRIYELTIRVIEEFVADSLKTPEKIAEVILLGPYLDQEHHRTLLNCLIAEFESATLLDITLLQGIIQLVQCAEVEYLDPEDLARILNVLRTRLQDIHRQLTKYSYYLTLALSRFLDVMVDGKVQGLRRVVDHGSLSTLLNDLVTIPDPYLKYQAAYALQALLHIPYDETRRKFMLQQAGNVAMGLLGVASVCKLDLSELKGGVNHLYRPEGNIHDFPINGVSGDQSLLESDQGIATSVKEGVMSGGQQLWYAALREAQEYISNGRLADFNHLVFEAPCCQDIEFQWGVCHMLELIAVSSEWDVTSRQHAIKFLAELCRNKTWATNEEVVLWTLQPLHRIAAFSDPLLSDQAQFALQGLEKERDAAKEILYRNVISNPVNPYPTAAPMCAPLVSPLLAQALVVPHVEHDLHRLRVQRLNERENALYVPPQAKPTLQATNETLFPLMERVQQFIAGSGPVFLLLGDSGGGKSTFNIQLERTLWQDYKRGGTIPLLINLPAIDDPTQDLVAKQLRYYDFSEEQIQELKLLREFVLICDGYDEGQLEVNIHSANEFHKPEQWKVKMIISCRSQYLDVDYRSHFHPQPSSIYGHEVELMVEAVIAPFSEEQIEQYVGQYVKGLEKRSVIQSRAAWTLEEYMEKLTKIPNLMELVSNPFLLALSLGALPGLVELKKDLSAIRITRVLLYDGFVKHWIDVNKARLESSTLSDNERSEFYLILDDDFDYHSIRFQKNLAAAIFKEQEGQPMVSYNQFSDRKTWKSTFFSSDVHTKLLRESSTLTRSGDFFRFIHRSLQEYFYSRTVYDPFDYDPDSDRASIVDPKIALSHRNFVSEPSVLQFLAERVEMDTSFKAQLLGAIEDSKVDSTAGVAAANAISILIKADERFNGADLRGIRIPGADLRGGEFDSADLEGADLSNVNLTKAWLRQSNLRKVVLTGVQFGELPYITADNCVANVVFSFDGEYLAVSQDQGGINIFDTKTWNKIASYPGRVTIAASPVSQELAKTSVNHAVDVGDIFTGQPRLILRGHEDRQEQDGASMEYGNRKVVCRVGRT
ncbi:hypothetical protein EC991_009995 [Linnemannia zychae]|nr:hypothetical protein EC991_009995 [Linnemannia zychae]